MLPGVRRVRGCQVMLARVRSEDGQLEVHSFYLQSEADDLALLVNAAVHGATNTDTLFFRRDAAWWDEILFLVACGVIAYVVTVRHLTCIWKLLVIPARRCPIAV